MKKQTPKIKWYTGYEYELFISLICVIALIFLVAFFTYMHFSKPDYTIKINECHNKTGVIGKVLINQTTNSCGYTRDVYGCMECKKRCASKEEFDYKCSNNTECHFFYVYGGMEEVYKKEFYLTVTQNWKDITETKEVCNQKEVDEIEYNYDIEKSTCQEVINKKCYIKKSDLTKAWLDKNCICISMCYSGGCIIEEMKEEYVDACYRDIKESKCSKYKCFDYEVEVK